MEINDIVSGFKVLQKQYIKEAASTAYEFEHVKSGARLFFLANDDDNKVFSITFRTPPTDDTGVAHIVEHSTLCGSRKYPLKEPFVELVKGSLNTFLNAMTFPDKTMYPVASRNDKDFQNLMDVYLDAVFYPAMYEVPEVLMQEGWHYEIEKPDEPLRYSGVVYNEMKGALSSPDGLLESRLMAALYPSTTYSYESGGDPAAIPQLTQQMFKDFHKKYYHPSNSYIFLYGDMDIEAKLAYLDREYLAHFDRIPVPSKIDKQPLFDGLHRVAEEYPIGADEAAKEKTFLALGSIVGDADDAETLLALEILEQALLKNPAAPLRQALIDAKLGKDVDSIFEDALLQPMFAIILNGTEPEKADKFYQVVHDTLAGFVKNGLDRTLLEAAINPLEFKLREADFGQYPKGLIYNIKIMNSWLYGSDPAMFLYYEQLIQRMKDGLDSHYFEDVIRRCLLDNPHQVLMTMKPSTTLAAAKEKKLEDALAVKKASLQPDDIQHIIKTTAKLKQRQQSPETPEALASIPILKLSDIRREITPLVLEEREAAGAKVLFSNVNTNGIGYLMLYFNLRRVPQELIPYAYLLLGSARFH
jgi:Zn-dependent M16 (insulinase) family peptidase